MAVVRTCCCLCQERAGKQSDGVEGDVRDTAGWYTLTLREPERITC
jgi:hypothetical protein